MRTVSISARPAAPARYPLELIRIGTYAISSNGKVFTDCFYKTMTRNIGVELQVRNNTYTPQSVRISACLYDANGNTLSKWSEMKLVAPKDISAFDLYVTSAFFAGLKLGDYKFQVWMDDVKVSKKFFRIKYK